MCHVSSAVCIKLLASGEDAKLRIMPDGCKFMEVFQRIILDFVVVF